MYDGIINVYKEKGYTSHDVVAKMRGILRMKKIGHTGTLDPDAEGVLPVCVGKGTKLVDMITDKEKTYVAVGKLGMTTDTQDISGRVLQTSELRITFPLLNEAAAGYLGEYQQLPPMYSAIKVGGRKLYELARQGIEIERERRPVSIRDIRILDFEEEAQEFTVVVDCGKGTYIRTLLHDIGNSLGCGCTMKKLVRTAVGQFQLEQSLRLAEIEELVREDRLSTHILTVDQVFEELRKLRMKPEYDKPVHNGNAFLPEQAVISLSGKQTRQREEPSIDMQSGPSIDMQGEPFIDTQVGQVRVYDSEEHFIGIYRYDAEKDCYLPVKMFL